MIKINNKKKLNKKKLEKKKAIILIPHLLLRFFSNPVANRSTLFKKWLANRIDRRMCKYLPVMAKNTIYGLVNIFPRSTQRVNGIKKIM